MVLKCIITNAVVSKKRKRKKAGLCGPSTRSIGLCQLATEQNRIQNYELALSLHMRIEEAIVYLLSTEGCGMTTETLAEQINLRRLHLRRDGQPVTSNQIYAVAMRFPEMFVKDGRLIRLMV